MLFCLEETNCLRKGKNNFCSNSALQINEAVRRGALLKVNLIFSSYGSGNRKKYLEKTN